MLQPRAALNPDGVRAAFAGASECFLATMRQVRDWDAPGLGEWNVRELVAHIVRAYSTIEIYLDAERSSDEMIDATTYYRVALSAPGVHEGVAARGREGALALTDPVVQCEAIAARLAERIAATPDDRIVENFAGRIPFPEYLVTRVIELAVHTLDLQQAIGVEPSLPDDVTSLCLEVLLPLPRGVDLLMGISGRKALNVFG